MHWLGINYWILNHKFVSNKQMNLYKNVVVITNRLASKSNFNFAWMTLSGLFRRFYEIFLGLCSTRDELSAGSYHKDTW